MGRGTKIGVGLQCTAVNTDRCSPQTIQKKKRKKEEAQTGVRVKPRNRHFLHHHHYLSRLLAKGLWGGSKGVINFLGFFYAMRCLVPVGHFRNVSGHLFIWLVCGSFQRRHGLLFIDCIVGDDKDKVIGFKRSH